VVARTIVFVSGLRLRTFCVDMAQTVFEMSVVAFHHQFHCQIYKNNISKINE